jgi:hypothetical protein
VRRVLLDENLPRLLEKELPGFGVFGVDGVGWAGTKNGALLRRAETEFDVFVTADRHLPYQQTIAAFDLGIVVLVAGSTKLEDLRPLAAELREAVAGVQPGHLLYVPAVRPGEAD